ncbi:MAG TPA: bifunctional riboflavin kinase/FAD synthetase [Bacteroidota bacterium]|nr:bifunctional riboflavin kinase/FAD synthetase [Bacteroidota bacterium]
MIVARSLKDVTRDANSVVTVGTFDGVHLAHREIIREVVNRAKTREGRSALITFEPHPKEVVLSKRGPVKLLSTIDERIELIGAMNVDLLLVVEFTKAFSRIGAREFYEKYIVNGTGVDEVVVGYDHMFGRDREAGIDELVHIGKEFGFSVFAVHPFTIEGEAVSSTRIRSALGSGDIQRARQLLGRPYEISGRVVRGDGRGAQIGFPTANLEPLSSSKVVPARGVYAVGARVGAEVFSGMMNIGVRPTIAKDGAESLEVHLFDFERDIYGQVLTVTFLRRLRPERAFASVPELVAQLERDRAEALQTVREHSR